MTTQRKTKKKERQKSRTITGVISVNSRGTGYVAYESGKEDIEIPFEWLNTALNGDTVEIILLPRQKEKRQAGEVVQILKRVKTRFVGVVAKEDGEYFLVPDDKRVYTDILISEKSRRKAKTGFKALVSLEKWTDPKRDPLGEIVDIVGKAGLHETEMRAMLLEHGFEATFEEKIEKEGEKIKRQTISEKDIKRRRDFREIPTFTIDPVDAKDFDDALSVQKLPNENIEVGVHIADVSHYVALGGAIDKEAQERGTSVYLVDRTIPMLPEVLSNDVCSLNPQEDKLTFSAVFELTPEGKVIKRWFGETIIHSNKRFTYSEAQKTLDTKSGAYYDELSILNSLAKKMRRKREAMGAIAFDQDEVKFKLDEQGRPLSVYVKERFDTNLLIEDFMLLANREVAEFVYHRAKRNGVRDMLFIYRIHDVPDEEKIEELELFLRAIGYEFKARKGVVSGQEINRLLKQIEGKPEENLIKTATIRSMAKAVYSTQNIGHFGLAFRHYTHFTSPIRRYPDIMVHRIMKSHLSDKKISEKELALYGQLAITSSQKEVEAVAAERDSIKYKQVEYMQDHIGEEFRGLITGVTTWGIYVEEEKTKAEGMVRLSRLSDDFYTLEKQKYQLMGEKTKKKYALGDSVRVKLLRADLESRTIDWSFV